MAPSAPFACAHRGLSAEKAENTLAAFGAAVAAGFPAIEMDLRTTSDGEVVVLHDAGIERTRQRHAGKRAQREEFPSQKIPDVEFSSRGLV
ncbi:MAG: glycerophosphodiester phosphodiesterase family protein, partial [Thermoplasmatota archaeon]